MDSGVITIGITIVIISIVIFFMKNFNEFIEQLNKKKENKNFKIGLCIIFIIFIICFSIYIYNQIISIKRNIYFANATKENDKIFAEYDIKIEKENKFYRNAINLNYEKSNPKVPYIPEGFNYVEGEWNNGFVIQDVNQNQFVWVPCSNNASDEINKLEKTNFKNPAFISKDSCVDEEYEDFIKSALENGGFYVSRYEIGKENEIPVSKYNIEAWTNITRAEAIEIANSMYTSINSKLINGYAYDTTLSWIKKNNNIKISKVESEGKIYTGRNNYNNIYDLLDSIMELTLETSYGSIVVRGFLDSEHEIDDCRYSISENSKTFSENSLITFRTVLYK